MKRSARREAISSAPCSWCGISGLKGCQHQTAFIPPKHVPSLGVDAAGRPYNLDYAAKQTSGNSREAQPILRPGPAISDRYVKQMERGSNLLRTAMLAEARRPRQVVVR